MDFRERCRDALGAPGWVHGMVVLFPSGNRQRIAESEWPASKVWVEQGVPDLDDEVTVLALVGVARQRLSAMVSAAVATTELRRRLNVSLQVWMLDLTPDPLLRLAVEVVCVLEDIRALGVCAGSARSHTATGATP